MNDLALSAKKRGRPLKFQSPVELEEKVNDYFADCERNKKHKTLSGLAVYVGTCTETLRRYEQNDENEAFCWIIKKAKTVIEDDLVRRMLEERGNVVKYLFLLKCNHGYIEKTAAEPQVQQGVQINIIGLHDDPKESEKKAAQERMNQSRTIEHKYSV